MPFRFEICIISAAWEGKVFAGFQRRHGHSCAAAGILRGTRADDVTLAFLDMLGRAETTGKARQAASSLGLPLRIIDVREASRTGSRRLLRGRIRKGRNAGPVQPLQSGDQMEIPVRDGRRLRIRAHRHGPLFPDRARQCGPRGFVPAGLRTGTRTSPTTCGECPSIVSRMAVAPLGDRIKSELRDELPEELHARESMGVCFLVGTPLRRLSPRTAAGDPSRRRSRTG